MKRLIVNADDFGLCSGAVTGVYHAWKHGIVTSASLLLTTPASGMAIRSALRHRRLDVGVHLCFTEGIPLLPRDQVPSLVTAGGQFPSANERRASRRRPNMNELQAEFRAQIERALQAGVTVSHLDLHTYAGYAMPDVFALSVDLAAEYGLAIRFPFGENWEDMASAVAASAGIPDREMHDIVSRCQKAAAERNVIHPDRFIEAFPEGDRTVGPIMTAIAGVHEGVTEMLAHPARAEGCTAYLGRDAKQRAAELALLCDPRVRRMIEIAKVELISYRDLK